MNPEAKKQLRDILQIDPSSLNKDQRDFLRARRSYLKKSEAREYAEVLDSKEKSSPVQEPEPPIQPTFAQPVTEAVEEPKTEETKQNSKKK